LNYSFSNLKIPLLIKESFIVSGSCRNGIDETKTSTGENWQVYPNPFKDEVNLASVEDFENVEYQLFTMSGILILSKTEKLTNNKLSLYLRNLSMEPIK